MSPVLRLDVRVKPPGIIRVEGAEALCTRTFFQMIRGHVLDRLRDHGHLFHLTRRLPGINA